MRIYLIKNVFLIELHIKIRKKFNISQRRTNFASVNFIRINKHENH